MMLNVSIGPISVDEPILKRASGKNSIDPKCLTRKRGYLIILVDKYCFQVDEYGSKRAVIL